MNPILLVQSHVASAPVQKGVDLSDTVLSVVQGYGWIVPLVLVLIAHRLVLRLFGVVIIPEDCIGIVVKKYRLFGAHRTLPDGSIVALKGEAGVQADTLAPGIRFWLWPWQYAVSKVPFTTVKQGQIGVVEARDGVPLPSGRVLARDVRCESFQNARLFLTNGGERGPQITIIPPGTYRINTSLFSVVSEPVTDIPDNTVGIVTTKEGAPLPTGDIAGAEVPGHNLFQDGQAFLAGGGFKGLQVQVMLAGRYFLNPRFATVEIHPMTEVAIAHVGVVIAFVGVPGEDVTGDTFKHGNLVMRGQRGVWAQPLDPGKYPINPYTHRVEAVSTANIVLNWADEKSEAHKLDEKLSTISVRSADGFTFNLDVSQIIHIPSTDAPRVIARFGSVANLVTQVLEPTIGNYFRNAAQGTDIIEFLRKRKERQDEAKAAIKSALDGYNVGAVDTLIGDIVPPPALMKPLTDRKIAEQERVTYETQRAAEQVRQELEQARALATTQARVVDAERSVKIAEYAANATIEASKGQAQAKKINAEADAKVLILVGEAEGTKISAVGKAEAAVIQQKTAAVGQANFALIEVSRALAGAGVELVPQIMAGGGGAGEGGSSSLVNLLLTQLLAQKKGEIVTP